ncbi:hypothetical protein [Alkaliflexus imshenetskii]|uniref:hypothetical protein n=1 Tax=Alkaliflexus imshenetskii TaxID=286730 RepID=UPI000479E5A0|nr:hypothetical protein [Alkaliflexus imshenetskii]
MKYEHQIGTSTSEVFSKLELLKTQQKEKGFLGASDAVDYRKIKTSIDKFSLDQFPSLINPFRGIGTITFEFKASESNSKIIIDIETYIKYGLVFIFSIFLFLTLPLLIVEYFNSYNGILKIGILWIVCWSVLFGFIYLSYLWNHKQLVHISMRILEDLGVKIKNDSNECHT